MTSDGWIYKSWCEEIHFEALILKWYLRKQDQIGHTDANINILAISTSEIKLSVIINENDTLKAVKKLHSIFELD